jgi:hypothetical protein
MWPKLLKRLICFRDNIHNKQVVVLCGSRAHLTHGHELSEGACIAE